jgi:hypothetical protein
VEVSELCDGWGEYEQEMAEEVRESEKVGKWVSNYAVFGGEREK